MVMENLEYLVLTIDTALDTQRKRRIVGGILLSASLFLGSLAITVLTIRNNQ